MIQSATTTSSFMEKISEAFRNNFYGARMRSLDFEPFPSTFRFDELVDYTYHEHITFLKNAIEESKHIAERFKSKRGRLHEHYNELYTIVKNVHRLLYYIVDEPKEWKNRSYIMKRIFNLLKIEESSVFKKPILSHYHRGVLVSMLCISIQKCHLAQSYVHLSNDELFQMAKTYIKEFNE